MFLLRLSCLLIVTHHSVTGQCLSELMFNRHIKNKFDLLKDSTNMKAMQRQLINTKGNRELEVSDVVFTTL